MNPRYHIGELAKLCCPSIPRTQFLDHPSASSVWLEPRYKEAATHCALLQEHAQQCYVRGKQEGQVREEWSSGSGDTGITGVGPGETIPELTPMAFSTSIRAIPELAAITERDLPGFADSSGCL